MSASRGCGIRASFHVAVLLALLAAGSVLGVGAPASASPGQPEEGTDGVTCPAAVAGVPFTSEPQFAGTTRPFANDQGILVRFTLSCPYARSATANPVYELTLEWSLYEADDLRCEEIEITSEVTDGGGIEGVLDDPNVSARVGYVAGSADDLPAIRDAATQLLADVPSNAYPCEGGAPTGVDGAVASSDDGTDEDLGTGTILAVGVVAGSAAVIVGGAMLASRFRRRKRRKAQVPATSGIDGLDVFRRSVPEVPAATQTPEQCWARVAEMDDQLRAMGAERDQLAAAAERSAVEIETTESALASLQADLASQRAHVAAIRNVAAAGESRAAYLSSYAGLTTLAASGANLFAGEARRAAVVVPDPHVAQAAAAVDAAARSAGAAAELGLDDARYWLWAERRLAVSDALRGLAASVPRHVELQRRLVVRAQQMRSRLLAQRSQLDQARAAVEAADDRMAEVTDERNRQATTAQILEDRARGDLVPSR